MRKYVQPAATRVNINKRIGWHTFRHTYSTLRTEPRWRGDGMELFYLSPAFQNNIMAVNVDESGGAISLGSPRTLFHVENIEATSQPFDVMPDGQRFLIATPNPLPGPVPLTLVMNWNAELKRK